MSAEGNTIRAVVRSLVGDEAVVEVAQGGCGRCHEEGGCGGQQLTQAFCSGPRHYRVHNGIGAGIGDHVLIAVSAGTLSRSANLAYGLPLIGLVSGAFAGNLLAGDNGAMIGGIAGLIVTFVYVIRRSHRHAGNSVEHPQIISRS